MLNKKNKIDFNKLFIWFIVLQPVLDVITSLFKYNNLISIGIIVRSIFLLAILLYWLIYGKVNKLKKHIFAYYIVVLTFFIVFVVNVISNYGFIPAAFLELIVFARFFYFPILFLALYQIFKEKKVKIESKHFYYIAIIYVVLLLLPYFTGTAFSTYKNEKVGTIGWFFSPNEVGMIVTMVSAFFLDYILNKKRNIFDYIISVLFIFSAVLIGTKVPLFGITILLASTVLFWLIKRILKDKNYSFKKMSCIIVIIPVFLILSLNSPSVKNIGIHLNILNINNIFDLFNTSNNQELDSVIFSSRDEYLKEKVNKYNNLPANDKFLGMGNDYSNTKIKVVEIDYYDVFFGYGFLGTLIYFLPFLCYFGYIIKLIFKNCRLIILKSNLNLLYSGLTVFLGMIVAYFSGHTFSSPAVSIYLIIFMIIFIINLENIVKIRGNDEKK